MCYFKQGTISRMLFRGMLFALLAVCYPEYSRAVIAEDYQANRLTSSLRTPKFFVKEFSYFLMPCHQHGLRINLLVQR